MKFVRLHMRAASAKAHTLRFQSQPLLDCRIAAQLDFATRAKNSLPG